MAVYKNKAVYKPLNPSLTMTWKKEYNQKRQAYLTDKQRQRRQKIKAQITNQDQIQFNKYYQANSIQVLITFVGYTELKKGQKLWSDFSQTLHDIQQGVSSIVEIMKLREIADHLIKDYWDTAHGKVKASEHWSHLTDDQQQHLIKYWSRERVRKEKNLATALEQQTQAAQQYEKEIQRAKYHEERGKENCHCSYCEQKRALRAEVEAEREQMWKDYEKADRAKEKKEKGKKRVKDYCMGCSKLRLLSADGYCRKCEEESDIF